FLESIVSKAWLDERQPLFHRFLRETSFLHGAFVVLAYSGQAAIECRLFGIYNEHRNSGVGAGHRNAATHRSSANNGGFADLVGASVFRYARNPGRGALREEGVDQRPRLIGCEALLDDFTFPFATFLE